MSHAVDIIRFAAASSNGTNHAHLWSTMSCMKIGTVGKVVDDDPFNLARFVTAQDHGGSFATALEEILEGRMTGHWIWWIFPQMAGLGSSHNSRVYSITSLDEATAFVHHPVLGPRLRQITAAMNGLTSGSASSILGMDDVKFQSSMTLFLRAAPDEELFRAALDRFFGGRPDTRSDLLLSAQRRLSE